MYKNNKSSPWYDYIITILIAVVIAVGIRSFAFEAFRIPSGSMIPTLLIGDYLFVSKFSYGYSRYSFPFGLLPIRARLLESRPQRGDVAVFRLPKDDSVDYIKRIIGLPGDRIQVTGGILHINGEAVSRTLVGDYTNASGKSTQYTQALPGDDTAFNILEVSDTTIADDTRVYVVPEGHYFMMGDNRDRSLDSRFITSVGFIPFENFIGRAEFIFFSIDGSFLKFWKWPTHLRFSRFFQPIQ